MNVARRSCTRIRPPDVAALVKFGAVDASEQKVLSEAGGGLRRVEAREHLRVPAGFAAVVRQRLGDTLGERPRARRVGLVPVEGDDASAQVEVAPA